MKFRHQVLLGLAVVLLVCGALPAPAEAQFTQQGPKLVGTGAVGGSGQGNSVSLSADGNTAIVGGPADNNYAGAAWVFTRSGGIWSQQGPKLVGSGAVGQAEQGSVAVSGDGDTAMVGGPVDSDGVGAAWVFTRSGAVWRQEAKLVGADAAGNSQQGFRVSLSSDGNTAIVGGPSDNNRTGAAWVFTRSSGIWSQQGPKLVGSGAVGQAQQGLSVSVSGDGGTAMVGGPVDNSYTGAAWVFVRSDGEWTQQGLKLVGSGAIAQAEQGYSVSLSGDGNTAIVGALVDPAGTWVFTRSDGVWTQQGSKLVGTGAVGPGGHGYPVSISMDGSTAIVGAPGDDEVGAVWVYAQPMFAGTPGKANCHGQSVSALARMYGGLNGATAALGYADVSALQSAIMTFCGG